MDLIDCVLENRFIKGLYPDGVSNDLCVGHLGLNADADFSLDIHVRKAPSQEVKKWGEWGKDYDRVVFVMRGTHIDNIDIFGCGQFDFERLSCSHMDERFYFELAGSNWKIAFSFKTLTIQQCRTYISDD